MKSAVFPGLAALALLSLGACATQQASAPASAPAPTASIAAALDTGGNPQVGGADMFPSRTIVENAVNSADHETLVAAVKAAGLVDTLNGPGPFTVFAPTDAAFEALPAGTVETLLEPENKDKLTQILTYHVVSGAVMSDALATMIADDNGVHLVRTVSGNVLTARKIGDQIAISDENGGVAMVTIADVKQSNGVIHVIDKVLLPAG